MRWPEDVEIPAGTRIQDWLRGPPYLLDETVFDEKDMALAYRTVQEAVERSINSNHPGFLQEASKKMMDQDIKRMKQRFSGEPVPAIEPLMKNLCRYERIVGGAVLHAYDWDDDGTVIHALDVYERTWKKVALADFLAGRVATEEDYAARNDKQADQD